MLDKEKLPKRLPQVSDQQIQDETLDEETKAFLARLEAERANRTPEQVEEDSRIFEQIASQAQEKYKGMPD